MRKELIKELIKEVYGPREGVEEEIDQDPWDEYLTGVLIPQKFKLKSDEGVTDPDSESTKPGEDLNPEDNIIDEEIDSTVPSELDPRMRTKSFGLSFIIQAEDPCFKICITWGRYFQIKDENKGDSESLWKRRTYYDIKKIKFNPDEKIKHEVLNNNENDGNILVYIKKTLLEENKYHITVNMVNDLDLKLDKKKYKPEVSSCIFQPSIRINLDNEKQLPNLDQIKEEEDELHFVYRNRPFKALGHMCSAIWKDIDYMGEFETEFLWPDGIFHSNLDKEIIEFIKPHIRSEFVPLYPMPLPSFKLLDDNESSNFSAEKLSQIWSNEEFDQFLSPILEKYEEWIRSNVKKKEKMDEKYWKITDSLIKKQSIALERMKLGLKTLKHDDKAKLAFCFANKAIFIQYKWSGKSEPFNWKPFQIAFFLMNIESIFNEDSKDRNILDLLWISTGGGKTEAYLALMAFALALRRLKALKDPEEKTGGGTSIISRYTLRLLTVQQFRRTLRLITAAEYLRVCTTSEGYFGWRPDSCKIKKDWIYGSTRFSIGMWVGSAVSPLHLRDKERGAIALLRKDSENNSNENENGEPAQVIKCPVCDSWLAIPETGLPKEDNKLYLVVKALKAFDISSFLNNLKNNIDFIEEIDVSNENHLDKFFTISLKFIDEPIETAKIDYLWDKIKDKFEIGSLNLHKPGYFGSIKDFARNKIREEFSDFEIWCPNPNCELNKTEWKEGVPIKEDKSSYEFPDGNFERYLESPFVKGTRIPIPAYTVDEQIYSRCPTVIISTADKIARLAFEPRAASLFGNIDRYNKFYGYHRNLLFPKDSPKASRKQDVPVKSFKAPDLIIQDELHLIDGPLGSLFGLYEAIIDGIIKKKGGNPKYIASTATIKNAQKQVNLLFSKNLFQFPPYGLNIEDSFFVKEEDPELAWDEGKEGRIYMGIYAPGRGPMTPQIRMWSRILKTSYDHQGEDYIKYYWSLVGYYNAIRELGGGGALYREDIEERLNSISKGTPRNLDPDHTVELSSRMSSTSIPLKLSEIERDGKKDIPSYDAIFTTSMFGTGVDISHLSLMIVNGQPKTTGSYIQATGRIGREHGGLVVTFLKAGRPRDLSHYETFPSYHYRIHMEIEPVSVSPFSKGALWKAMGSSAVSFLRNAQGLTLRWCDDDGTIICDDNANKDLKYLCKYIESRLNNIYGDNTEAINSTMKCIKSQLRMWKKIAENTEELKFWEYKLYNEPKYNVVLGDPAHEHMKKLKKVFTNVPQSLREIEETIGFWV